MYASKLIHGDLVQGPHIVDARKTEIKNKNKVIQNLEACDLQ